MGIDALEVSTAKKWLREEDDAPETLVMFSDSRPGEQLPGREGKPTIEHYAYGFTYIRCDEMTVPAIKLAFKDPRNANVFDEENDFEILPEGVPVSKRVNVLVGKRSTGKTFTLERIMDSLDQGDYAYIKQFGITEGAVDDTFRKNSDQEDDAFAEEHFSAVQNILSDCLACTDDNKNKVCDFCEAVVTFAKSPEDTCSSYPIFTAQAFSTDSISNQIKDDIELCFS